MAAPIIERQLLEKLERLTIRWQKSFRGLVGGHNASRYAGPGQEFLDHRHFHQGDDLRSVNWRAYMRLEKLFLKMFQVEPRTPIRLLLDASESMVAGHTGSEMSKFDYARKLTAALVYVGLVRHDSLSIQPFHEHLSDPITASGGRHRFGPAADYLSALKAGGRTSFFELARQFISEYPKPGLLIIVSDFLDDGDPIRPIQYLADFGHEIMLLHVWTESERFPQLSGDVALTDAETGQRLEISLNDEACAAYTKAFDDYAASLEQLARRNGGRYAGLSTSFALEDAIFKALMSPAAQAERAGAGRPA